MRAMVLAAGLGTRLRPITYAMPKPMVPVLNRPVMEHIVRLLARHGFSEAIANLHWFPETIEGHFGDGSDFGIELSYSREEQLLGHGRRRPQRRRLPRRLLPGDLRRRAHRHRPRARCASSTSPTTGIATLATKRVGDTNQFGVVITGDDGRIQGFQEKPEPAEALSDLANCGIYMFRAEIFDFFPEPGTSKAAGPGRSRRLRRLGDGRLPGAAGERRALLLARDRGLLERHRQPRRAARRATSTPCAARSRSSPACPRWATASARRARSRGSRSRAGADRRRRRARRRAFASRARRSSATAAGSAPAPGCATRSCSPAPSCRRRRCWSAPSRVASPSPDAFLTVLRATGAPRPRTIGAWRPRMRLAAGCCPRSAPPAGALPARTRCSARAAPGRLADAAAAGRRGPPGLDRAWSSAPHEGVARDLVSGAEVPPPAAGRRADRRADRVAGAGEPAQRRDRAGADRAAALARRAASIPRPRSPRRWPSAWRRPCRPCLARSGGRPPGRQAPGPADRPAAAGHLRGEAPRSALLVDDVLPPARRSRPVPGPCVAPARSG